MQRVVAAGLPGLPWGRSLTRGSDSGGSAKSRALTARLRWPRPGTSTGAEPGRRLRRRLRGPSRVVSLPSGRLDRVEDPRRLIWSAWSVPGCDARTAHPVVQSCSQRN